MPENERGFIKKWLSHRFDSYTPESSSNLSGSTAVDKAATGAKEFPEFQQNCNNDADPQDEPDFTIENYFVFDDFIKSLKICAIMQEVVQKTEELMGVS